MPRHPVLRTFGAENHHDLPRLGHFDALAERDHQHVVLRELQRHAPDSVLPERAHILQTVQGDQTRRVLAEVDGTVVLLESWKSDAHVWVSGPDELVATAVAEEIKARVPQQLDEGRVEVEFTDASTGSRTLPLDVRPWAEVADHYPAQVRASLDTLTAYRPEVSAARRLVLWHGVPGTGKTTAVRALLHAWRDWADTVVVTDPESLLSNGKYLRRILLDDDEEDRWKLYVLEDAESLLRKETGGSAMGKLLNLADGLLGQGLRCLFLITTNEALGAIHPAVVRPGRCLAQVEFTALPASQAAGLLGRPVDRPMTLAEVMSAAPVQAPQPALAVGQYL